MEDTFSTSPPATVTHWLLATGCWLLAAGRWLLAAGYWLLATGCWLLVAGYWLLDKETRVMCSCVGVQDFCAR